MGPALTVTVERSDCSWLCTGGLAAADALADVPGPDDDAVLDERDAPPCDQPRERPRGENRNDRRGPEHDQLRNLDLRQAGKAREHEQQPGAKRDHVQHRRRVVGRRVVGSLRVAPLMSTDKSDHVRASKMSVVSGRYG